MKYLSFLIAFIFVLAHNCEAQITIGLVQSNSNSIKLKHSMNQSDAAGKLLAPTIPAKTKLKFLARNGGQVIVADKTTGSTRYVDISDLYNARKKINISAIGGAVTFPFKYRDQSHILEPSLSLSGVAGIHLALDNDTVASVNFLIGFGPSSITLNKNNSTDTSSTGSTRSAATLSFTLLGQWDNIQLAFSLGIDNNLDNTTDKWIYQSKPWFALGIGFNLFSKSSN